jgi:hypothetical protein
LERADIRAYYRTTNYATLHVHNRTTTIGPCLSIERNVPETTCAMLVVGIEEMWYPPNIRPIHGTTLFARIQPVHTSHERQ